MSRVRRAVGEYALRIVLVGLLAVSFAFLLRESPPMTRLRPDLPNYGDVRILVLVVASVLLAVVPLLLPRRAAFMAAVMTSGLVVGLGVYAHSRIDWANIPSGGGYASGTPAPPELLVLAAVPFVLLMLYHVVRVPGDLALDARERGAPEADAVALRRATRAHAVGAVAVTLLLWLPVAAAIIALPSYRDSLFGALGAFPRVTLLGGVALLALAFGPLAWERLRRSGADRADGA